MVPNEEDWKQAHALQHLEHLDAARLRSCYRELAAYNFMLIRSMKELREKLNEVLK